MQYVYGRVAIIVFALIYYLQIFRDVVQFAQAYERTEMGMVRQLKQYSLLFVTKLRITVQD